MQLSLNVRQYVMLDKKFIEITLCISCICYCDVQLGRSKIVSMFLLFFVFSFMNALYILVL